MAKTTSHVLLGSDFVSPFKHDSYVRELLLRLVYEATEGTGKLGQLDRKSMLRLATTFTGGYVRRRLRHENTIVVTRKVHDIEEAFLSSFLAWIEQAFPEKTLLLSDIQYPLGDASLYDYLIQRVVTNRWIFHTNRGFLRIGPQCMKDGDIVVVLDGGLYPFVLRPTNNSEYTFLGESYVYDIACGQINDMLGNEGVERREFSLR